ncbi:MAG: DNA polymerase III, subunit gamma and tau [Elusimicrobia bacterium GWA2_69_24]|nr:MAG: DNA polymerase III, subunit gamma and tau [Elusimicrobia bacterium GWA2_69_24]HBL19013.1 DNA polymerase III subunit gamma/tau [Elusimicrobiota bacterium]
MKKNPQHLALARKYRPQRFEDLVGQDAVSTTLKNAVESNQVGHAYLFFGPRGTGKTTSARILAKALNCAKGPTPTPCGECPACTEIAAGTCIDVLELDAASNTQVDKIREMIIETVSLAPSRDRRKVFVIDEVHMLSISSFNALLKTLEEPPPHVVFILATTELAKIPATIVSRCQRFRFRPIGREETAAYLKKIAKIEKIEAEDAALAVIARASGGALRDAVSLLDQACAYGEGKLTPAALSELIGTLPAEFLLGIMTAVLAKDAAKLSEWLGKVSAEGFDATQILRDLRDYLQDLYLQRLGVSSGLGPEWAALAGAHPAETFSFLLSRVNRTLEDIHSSDSPQVAFELGVYGMLEAAYDLRGWVSRLEALERRLAAGGAPLPAGPSAAAPMAAPTPARSAPALPSAAPAPAPAAPRAGAPAESWWNALIERIHAAKPALASGLEGCRLAVEEGGSCRLLFKQAFNMERAQAHKAFVEEELRQVAGKPIRLVFEVEKAAGKAPARGGDEAQEWVDSSEGAAPTDAGVQKALNAFGGKVRQLKKKP